jgi:hypothetical protein
MNAVGANIPVLLSVCLKPKSAINEADFPFMGTYTAQHTCINLIPVSNAIWHFNAHYLRRKLKRYPLSNIWVQKHAYRNIQATQATQHIEVRIG